MGIQKRYRLEKTGSWIDGIEFLHIVGTACFAVFVAHDWVLPVVLPVIMGHYQQLWHSLHGRSKHEPTLLVMVVDIMALIAQYLVHFGVVPPMFRLGTLVDDRIEYNYAKLGCIGVFIMINFVRMWQYMEQEDDNDVLLQDSDGRIHKREPDMPERIWMDDPYNVRRPILMRGVRHN